MGFHSSWPRFLSSVESVAQRLQDEPLDSVRIARRGYVLIGDAVSHGHLSAQVNVSGNKNCVFSFTRYHMRIKHHAGLIRNIPSLAPNSSPREEVGRTTSHQIPASVNLPRSCPVTPVTEENHTPSDLSFLKCI